MGRAHKKVIMQIPVCHAKIFKKMYKPSLNGYNYDQEKGSTTQKSENDSKILHIESLSGKLISHRHKNFYTLHESEAFAFTSFKELLYRGKVKTAFAFF